MKIEMGESIVYSWLKHCKGCGIVQLNWKPSPYAIRGENKTVLKLLASAQQIFVDFPNLFKKNKPDQIVKQCEIDVLGYNFKDNVLYASEVAFHEAGLIYGDTKETVRRVTAKMIRAAMAMRVVFQGVPAKIVFISPKVGGPCGRGLEEIFTRLDRFSREEKMDCSFIFIANDGFRSEIFDPVCKVSLEVADTSELFMRSLKLAKMFEGPSKNKRIRDTAPAVGQKIGESIQITFVKLFEQNKITRDMLKLLQDKAYSRNNFKLSSYSVVKNVNDPDFPAKRYWTVVFAGKYAVCSQWTERHRPFFDSWLKNNFGDL